MIHDLVIRDGLVIWDGLLNAKPLKQSMREMIAIEWLPADRHVGREPVDLGDDGGGREGEPGLKGAGSSELGAAN